MSPDRRREGNHEPDSRQVMYKKMSLMNHAGLMVDIPLCVSLAGFFLRFIATKAGRHQGSQRWNGFIT